MCCYACRAVASGEASGARAPPFEIGASHFMFGPFHVTPHIQYFILKMLPPCCEIGPVRLWYCQRTFSNAPDVDLQYNVGEKLRK